MVDVTDDYETESPSNKPYKDEELMRELYDGQNLSMMEISRRLDCAPNTVRDWLSRHGIEQRPMSESIMFGHSGGVIRVPFYTHKRGHEMWRGEDDSFIPVHRLQAVAEWGFEAVKDKHVHHKNGIPWDNRPENLELLSNSDHQKAHRKVKGEDRHQIAERYHNTEDSSYDIAEDWDIDPVTVMNIYYEFYPEEQGGEKAT